MLNKEQLSWLTDNADNNAFAKSLLAQLTSKGTLSPLQVAAIDRNVSRIKPASSNAAVAVESVAVSDVSHIINAFDTARFNKIARPKMWLGEFLFKAAPTTGRNPNSIYVTKDSEYLGRIADNKFMPTAACSSEVSAQIVEVCSDPKAAAHAFGQKTGTCSCCGRALIAAESVELSIGPICRAKYGF